jgi:acetolactate synthase-1/3 small subunit
MTAVNSYVLSVTAEDSPGLLSILINMLNEKRITIDSVSAARTEVYNVVYITLELRMDDSGTVRTLINQVTGIIKVIKAEIIPLKEVCSQRTALISVSSDVLKTERMQFINKSGAQVMYLSKDILMIQKTGSEDELGRLYDALNGKELLNYQQSGLMTYYPRINL